MSGPQRSFNRWFHLQGPAPSSGAPGGKGGLGMMEWSAKADPRSPRDGGEVPGAIAGLPLTLLPTYCHLTSPQPPGFQVGGASERLQGGSGEEETQM